MHTFAPASPNFDTHTFTPVPTAFYDPNILPPSASQTHVPTIRCTPSLSPLVFYPLLPLSSTNTHHSRVNTVQFRHHSIFTPQILHSPLPINTPSTSICPHSVCLPSPVIHSQPNNIITPQPVHPIPLNFNQNFSPPTTSSYIPHTSNSNHSQCNYSSRSTMNFSLPTTKDIPLLMGKHDWGPWYSAVSSLVLCSNLLSHIADNLLPDAAYDSVRMTVA
jgi:hypothetical protein